MKKRIFITGKSGMLGGEMSYYLEHSPDIAEEVHSLTRSDVLEDKLISEECRIINTDRNTVYVNCAAMTDTVFAETTHDGKVQSWLGNVKFPEILAKRCVRLNARLIHFSTDYVFNGQIDNQLFSDRDDTFPVSVYGQHKFTGEAAIQASGADYAILRTSWLYGKNNEKSFIHKFSYALINALSQGKTVEVPDNERSIPTPTSALIAATELVLENNLCGVIHAVPTVELCEIPPSRYDWAKAIGDILHEDWIVRKFKGFSTYEEDMVWERYNSGSVLKKAGGKTDIWRPVNSAMLVSQCVKPVFLNWRSHLINFLTEEKYGAYLSHKMCENIKNTIIKEQ